MIDFSKYKKDDTVQTHCCDDCMRRAKNKPKYPPDSGTESWLCSVCGHYGIGSTVTCKIGDWLILRPIST